MQRASAALWCHLLVSQVQLCPSGGTWELESKAGKGGRCPVPGRLGYPQTLCREPVGEVAKRQTLKPGPGDLSKSSLASRAAALDRRAWRAEPFPAQPQRLRHQDSQSRSMPGLGVGPSQEPCGAGVRPPRVAPSRAQGSGSRRGNEATSGKQGYPMGWALRCLQALPEVCVLRQGFTH